MIKISVVIPAKNRAHTLPACLESILRQTVPVQEIIIVDDNSTDETRSVVETYASRGVRYERLVDHRGAQAARNLGVRRATYSWIAFQDSDDIWLPSKIEKQLQILNGMAGIEHVIVHTAGIKSDKVTGQRSFMNADPFEGNCYRKILIQPGPMFQGLLVSKQQLHAIDLLDEACPSYQEWDTAIRLAKQCTFIHIQEPLFEWVWHSGATISKDMGRDFMGFNYVIQKHRNEIIKHHGQSEWRTLHLQNVARALHAGYPDIARSLMQTETRHSAYYLARGLASLGMFPGAGRLLKLFAKMPL